MANFSNVKLFGMYPMLENPPVVVALAQVKFNLKDFKVQSILEYDTSLKHKLPIRKGNIQVGLNLENKTIPLGESKVSGISNAEIGSYIYLSTNQKAKLEISEDTLTYIDENPYAGWDAFISTAISLFSILSPILENAEIQRTSIRFVNRFIFNEFDDPKSYFNALITSADGNSSYPLRQYGFRMLMDIPDTDIYSIVNHNVENVQDKFFYTFDIDVLDRQTLVFDIDTIRNSFEHLRSIKNTIFFDTLTEKTLQLCNSHK